MSSTIATTAAAVAGSKLLVEYFMGTARAAGRYFIAGPTWNFTDKLALRQIQFLRYTFRGAEPQECFFSIEELAQYGVDATVSELMERKIQAQLTAA